MSPRPVPPEVDRVAASRAAVAARRARASVKRDVAAKTRTARNVLQVAWADDDVALKEADALLAFGRRSQLSEEQLELLADCLAGKTPLPPPHFGLLKERRVEVLRAIKELLGSELRVGAAEDAILEQISALLR